MMLILTEREQQLLRLIGEGLTNREIRPAPTAMCMLRLQQAPL